MPPENPPPDDMILVNKRALIRLILELERQSCFNDWALLHCERALQDLSSRLHGGLPENGFLEAKQRLFNLFLSDVELEGLLTDARLEAWQQEFNTLNH